MNVTHFYLDMDGLISGFTEAACKLFNAVPPQIKSIDNYDTCGIDISLDDFWNRINTEGESFWTNLPRMPHADFYIEACKCSGLHWSILTRPSRNWRDCVNGKYEWLKRNYGPWVASKMIPYHNKEEMSCIGRLLIDDCEKNAELWRQAGGLALVPDRPWNTSTLSDDEVLQSLYAWGK